MPCCRARLLSVVCLLVSPSLAFANEAFLTQVSANVSARTQSSLSGMANLLNQTNASLSNASRLLASPLSLASTGQNLAPSFNVSASNANFAELVQSGKTNSATITQQGAGNMALVMQQGQGNKAVVYQSGRAR